MITPRRNVRQVETFRRAGCSLLRRANATDALVPALVAQPLLQRLQTDFGIAPAQARDVRLESRFVEPSEHLVELPAEEEPDHRQGQPAKLYGLAEDPAEDFRGLQVGQFAPCQLQFPSDELLRPFECEGHEAAD